MFNRINDDDRENLINKNIDQKEIYFVPMSVVNDIGIAFIWKNRFFRAINYNAHDKIKHMFGCGMIDELVACNLFPKCRITDYILDGFSLIIEITKLNIVSYPYEWSFTMLKDAATTVLEVNVIAKKYGYQTKDGHPFNITFDGTHPIFIDLGSFVKLNNEFDGWIAYEEFMKSFYYPLKIFSKGNAFIGRSMISNEQDFLSHYEYIIYCNKLFIRCLNSDFINRLINFIYRVKRISTVPNETIKKKIRNSLVANVIIYLKKKNIFPFQHTNYSLLMKKIERISMKRPYSEWGSYQDELHDNKGEMISSLRFDRICSIIKSYGIKTSIELGANQGILSRLLINCANLDCVIATDNDENAIDTLYLLAEKR